MAITRGADMGLTRVFDRGPDVRELTEPPFGNTGLSEKRCLRSMVAFARI